MLLHSQRGSTPVLVHCPLSRVNNGMEHYSVFSRVVDDQWRRLGMGDRAMNLEIYGTAHVSEGKMRKTLPFFFFALYQRDERIRYGNTSV